MGWLRDILANSPLPATHVRSEADAAGLSWATIKRAKKAGGFEHFREGGVADRGRWFWRLSTSERLTGSSNAYLAQDINVSQLDKFEPVRSNEAAGALTLGNGKPPAGDGAHRGNDHDTAAGTDLTVPLCLDRRHEVCGHCGQPGGHEWDYEGTKVRLHSHCERAWIDGRRNGGAASMGAH